MYLRPLRIKHLNVRKILFERGYLKGFLKNVVDMKKKHFDPNAHLGVDTLLMLTHASWHFLSVETVIEMTFKHLLQ